MGWFHRLEERLEHVVREAKVAVVTAADDVAASVRGVAAAGVAAIEALSRDAPEIAERAAVDTYQKLIGNDLHVLRDPHAGAIAKAEAAFDLASTFTMPLEKIPAVVVETTLESLIAEGGSTALVAAMKSLEAGGHAKALVGVESALLSADPAAGTMLASAGIDRNDATATLAALGAALAAGKDLPAAATSAIVDVAAKLHGPGSLETRLASLHAAFGELEHASQDLGTISAAATAAEKPRSADSADIVRETLAKISPEVAERIRKSGRAEVGLPHAEAMPWDGRGQIGSVTSVIGSRVEQYVGKGWMTYDAAQLAPLQSQLAANAASGDPTLPTTIAPGDELRVGANGAIALVPYDAERRGLQTVSIAPAGRAHAAESVANRGR